MGIELTKGQRIAALCSAIWLVLIFVLSLNLAEHVRGRGRAIDFVELLGVFMIFGVVPVLMLWGIIWIRSTPEKMGKIEDFLVGVPLSPEISCPRCGAQMKLKTTKSGPNAGKVFWGCSRFPVCIQIAPLSAGTVKTDA